jgi:DNA-binding transcriptional LysR family regulator
MNPMVVPHGIMNATHDGASRLARLDMNLLVALDTLLKLQNVTQAAERLGVTQSAMSHTLRRLRETFDDPLLVRAGAAMLPTPRAEALGARLSGALAGLAHAIDVQEAFDPAHTARSYRFASPDLFDALVLPHLLKRFASAAPGATVTVAPGLGDLPQRLASGALDVAVAPLLLGANDDPFAPTLASDLRTKRLLKDRFVAFVRARHPVLTGKRLGPRAFGALDHVLVSPTGKGDGVVDQVLEAKGVRRRVVLRAPHFATALAVTRETDLVLVAPGALRAKQQHFGLRELPLSFHLPEHALQLVWHPRYDADPGHRWFRERMGEAAAALEVQA